MSLKDRLGRLGPGAPVGPESKPAPTLDDLRAKMQAMLVSGGSAERSDPLGRQLGEDEDELRPEEDTQREEALQLEEALQRERELRGPLDAFLAQTTAAGRLHQLLARQPLSAHVGRIPLSAAADADMGVLSLLALDPSLSGLDPRRALYFDTETTGLGGAGSVAFLVGLGWFSDSGEFVLEQLLLRSPAEEAALLARFAELAMSASFLVSFNGKSFDWPLLQGRRVMNQLGELQARPHLDLLHVGRRLHKARLTRCNLKTLEAEVLGWERSSDDIPGEDIPPRYGHFLRTGDEFSIAPVVDHNAWDVLSMAALVGLYGEPFGLLTREDLASLGQTFHRAGSWENAERAAEEAISSGQRAEGLRLRANVHKARGDKARALLDLEELAQELDDPWARLELVKLLEHHMKDFQRALELSERGTGETLVELAHRQARLTRRRDKSLKNSGK